MKILITGGCGFVGHHVVEHFLKATDWEIIVFDKLTYASNGFDRLRDIEAFDDKRVRIFTADLSEPWSPGMLKEVRHTNYVIHLAAETHVDNSIIDPRRFVIANVLGTLETLQAARSMPDLLKFFYFSTDEVFGPAPPGVAYEEDSRYRSTNPYSASKAGGEELAVAYENTFCVPVVITHTMNCFGERQHPEKFIPKVINCLLEDKTVTIHADRTKLVSGSRFYIHCRNVANAIHFLFEHGEIGQKYNIVGEREVSNLELAMSIAQIMGKKLKYEMVDFHSSRPGHDLRYALDGSKMQSLGWRVPLSFEASLKSTVLWMLKNKRKSLEVKND